MSRGMEVLAPKPSTQAAEAEYIKSEAILGYVLKSSLDYRVKFCFTKLNKKERKKWKKEGGRNGFKIM